MSSRTTSIFLAGALALLTSVDARAAEEAGLTADVKFCEKLERFKPADPQTSFTQPPTKKVYAWTLIKGGKGAFSVNHAWFKNGKQVFKHKINVKGSRYPTWSFLFVSKGSYKLEVSDENDQVFAQGEFTVK
jgi:hypothetical protein